jgi:hypothetical protein
MGRIARASDASGTSPSRHNHRGNAVVLELMDRQIVETYNALRRSTAAVSKRRARVTQRIANKGRDRLVDLGSRKRAASWCEAAHFRS